MPANRHRQSVALEPDILVLDEPTSALDVSVQARILTLLWRLQQEQGFGLPLVAHDLAVVESVADSVAVMYAGRIVESGNAQAVLFTPSAPLFGRAAWQRPIADPSKRASLAVLEGDVPSAIHPPQGAAFIPAADTGRPSVKRSLPPSGTLDKGWAGPAICPTTPFSRGQGPGESSRYVGDRMEVAEGGRLD